eukprot:24310-Eustigmatos_ZCMA.PRE.1
MAIGLCIPLCSFLFPCICTYVKEAGSPCTASGLWVVGRGLGALMRRETRAQSIRPHYIASSPGWPHTPYVTTAS